MSNDNNDDLLTGAFNTMAAYLRRTMENSLPCKVVSVSDDRQSVSVQPLIKIVGTDGSLVSRGNIDGIPVFAGGSSTFLMSFPLSAGDLGWIDACDRDISIFLQSYAESAPGTKRKHSFSDARFVPDIMTNYTIADEDSEAMVIQSADGSVKIALHSDKIKLSADTIELVSDTLTHNGVNIGETHVHAQGVDSAGNTEQNTEVPQ